MIKCLFKHIGKTSKLKSLLDGKSKEKLNFKGRTTKCQQIIELDFKINIFLAYSRYNMSLKKISTTSGLSSFRSNELNNNLRFRPSFEDQNRQVISKSGQLTQKRKNSLGTYNRQILHQVEANSIILSGTQKNRKQSENFKQNRILSKNIMQGNQTMVLNSKNLMKNEKEDKNILCFINDLKSRQSNKKIQQKQKYFEKQPQFQFQFTSEQAKKDLICTRLISIKRLEKHQKQAIRYFYQNKYEESFNELMKSEHILHSEGVNSKEHELYINYLYSQFSYKLGKIDACENHLSQSNLIISKLSSEQKYQLSQYVINIKVLETAIKISHKDFKSTLKMCNLIAKQNAHLSDKIMRKIKMFQLEAFIGQSMHEEALLAMHQLEKILQNETNITSEKKNLESNKLFVHKIEILLQLKRQKQAISEIETKISFFEGQQHSSDTKFSFYDARIYEIYFNILQSREDSAIRLIYFCHKWLEMTTVQKQKIKITLFLYRLYFKIGDYESAIQVFSSIADPQNIRYYTSFDYQILAEIKSFEEENQESESILLKAISICDSDQYKTELIFKLLQYYIQWGSPQQKRKEKQKILQKRLRSNKFPIVREKYANYLKRNNQFDRALTWQTKLLLQTAKFGDLLSNQCEARPLNQVANERKRHSAALI